MDTNVWLELLLEQNKAEEVRRLLQAVEADECALTDFSLHSIGVVLTRLNKDGLFLDFLRDTLEDSRVSVIRLGTEELKQVAVVRGKFRLDFDDSYQYLAAQKFDLTLVSFDSDFDGTERGRKTPADAGTA